MDFSPAIQDVYPRADRRVGWSHSRALCRGRDRRGLYWLSGHRWDSPLVAVSASRGALTVTADLEPRQGRQGEQANGPSPQEHPNRPDHVHVGTPFENRQKPRSDTPNHTQVAETHLLGCQSPSWPQRRAVAGLASAPPVSSDPPASRAPTRHHGARPVHATPRSTHCRPHRASLPASPCARVNAHARPASPRTQPASYTRTPVQRHGSQRLLLGAPGDGRTPRTAAVPIRRLPVPGACEPVLARQSPFAARTIRLAGTSSGWEKEVQFAFRIADRKNVGSDQMRNRCSVEP